MNLLPYGPRAVLAEFDSLDDVMAAASAWRAAQISGVVDIVPAARTVLVQHDGTLAVDALTRPESGVPLATGELVEIPVRYDGDDLHAVAEACGLTVPDVVTLHSDVTYTAAFCGFMPGFSYLVGLDERLVLPRRATPRTRVPAGAVAIASTFTAVYPSVSPGGWHLLGHTEVPMWVPDRATPAAVPPGTRVRFVVA